MSGNPDSLPPLPKFFFFRNEYLTTSWSKKALATASGPERTLGETFTKRLVPARENYSRKTFACGNPEKGMAKVSHKAHGRRNGFVPAFVPIHFMPIPGGVRVCLLLWYLSVERSSGISDCVRTQGSAKLGLIEAYHRHSTRLNVRPFALRQRLPYLKRKHQHKVSWHKHVLILTNRSKTQNIQT